MSEGYFPRGGVNLFYTVQGPDTGIPVILLHGWICDQTDWVYQIPALLRSVLQPSLNFRIIAPDLRGHGRSTVQADITAFDPITLTEDVAALARHLNVSAKSPAIIIGHSLGGALVNEFAARHSDLVQGLVLIDPAYYMPTSIMQNLVEEFRASPDTVSQTATAFIEGAYTPQTPSWLKMWHQLRAWGVKPYVMVETFAQLADYLGPSEAEYLRKAKARAKVVPRLVVCASRSSLEIEKEGGLDEKYDRVEVLEAGHFLHKSDDNRFNTILISWLEQWEFLSNSTSKSAIV